MNIIKVATADSTNSRLAAMDTAPHATVLSTRRQTAGRGQRGNTWESEPDKNITLSILFRPESLSARCQFVISEIVALGIVKTLEPLLRSGEQPVIKWPNDIYVGDRKICGILIENSIMGERIDRSIAGIGLNVNQARFLSDAPNPVSLRQLTGMTFDLDDLEQRLCRNILGLYDSFCTQERHDELHSLYCSTLWRREGMHCYRDTATGEPFAAAIHSVGPMGHLTLLDEEGKLRTFAFKEVEALLNK